MSGIYRYLAISSAVAMLLAMVVIGLVYRHYAAQGIVRVSEMHGVALAKALSNTVGQDFGRQLESLSGLGRQELLARVEADQLDRKLHALTEGLPIVKVKIYSPQGLTIYSSEHAQIGEDRSAEPAFRSVAQGGAARSKLSFRDSFSAFSGELFNRDIIETYVPLKNVSGEIMGVFELYSDVTETTRRLDRTLIGMTVALAAVFVVLYGGLILVVIRRGMAPLRLASDRAATIGPRSARVRLPTQGMPSEVLPLVQAVNGALDRLDQALDSQRRFTADAAHELLTPLAVLRANLDTMEDETVADRMRADVEIMSDVVAQLLELAALDSLDTAEEAAVDLRAACLEVVSMMAPVAYKQGKEISLTGASAPVILTCSRRGLSAAVRNLVKNAITHTAPGTAVEVDVGEDGAIRVIDRGPGVPAAERDRIFERFWRGKRGDGSGAGLGLSIVKRFVDASGGTVEVGEAPGGGAAFTIRLPRTGRA